jgi:rare lipoprotein A
MKYILRGIGVLAALIIGFMLFTACTPGKAQTRNNDGAAAHNFDSNAKKGDYSSDDQTYNANDDFDIENKDVEAAPPARVKTAKKAAVNEDAESDEPPVNVKSAKKAQPDDNVEVSGEEEKYFQKGVASWYGREFQGKKTASGEKFNMNELTAAHRTLPLGSVILVKNLDNGKTVKVRINDRGPFKGKRILDLSYAAAKKLDFLGEGETMVGIKVIGTGSQDYSSNDASASDDAAAGMSSEDSASEPKKQTHAFRGSDSDSFLLQSGAFLSKRNADKLRAHISDMLPDNDVTVFLDGDLYKVRVGGIASKKEADKCKRVLEKEEIPAFVVKQQ